MKLLDLVVETYLDVARSAVEVHVQVLDRAKFTEHVLDILLGRFLMDIRNNDDPPLN